jgi:hypothetical protein
MLSFQIINEGRGIQIACDDRGMATLVGALEKIRPTGGRELSEKTPWGAETIGEVIITWAGD